MTPIEEHIVSRVGARTLDDAMDALADQYSHRARRSGVPIKLRDLASALRVRTITTGDLPCDGVLLPQANDEYEIVLSSAASKVRRRFSLAHELGHVILHKLVPETRSIECRTLFTQAESSVEETICDKLAARLLMPTHIFKRDMGSQPVNPTYLRKLATKYQVSLSAIARRCAETCQNRGIAIARAVRRDDSGDVIITNILVNFAPNWLRPDVSAKYDKNTTIGRAFKTGVGCRGWDWFNEPLLRRHLFFVAEPPTNQGDLALCIIARDPVSIPGGISCHYPDTSCAV